MAEFAEIEASDGIRMSWNIWPNSRVEMVRCVIPAAVVISPLHPLAYSEAVLSYPPLRCRTCRAILNPYCQVDFIGKLWTCPFDFTRNSFPANYGQISESYLPGELYQQYTTIEYKLSEQAVSPVFLFVLDTCLIEEEMEFLRTSLIQAISLLPPNAMIGLVTYGTHVHVHEIGFRVAPKSYVFKGSREYTKEQILDQLGLTRRKRVGEPVGVVAGPRDGLSESNINRFLLPASECEFTISSMLEELQKDAFPFDNDKRASRCTGTAISVAAGLLGACVPGTGARIMTFVGGPCTEGPGTIVGKELSEPIRSHKDVVKGLPLYGKAVKFYEGLASQLINQGHVLDVFACALDQVGLAEMKVAIERSGGIVILAESFGNAVYKESFKRLFEEEESSLGLSFNGIFEVSMSKDVRVQGVIGPCSSLERAGLSVSESVIGQGNTTAWRMSGLDQNTSLTVFFDIASGLAAEEQQKAFFLQFVTHYQHSSGEMRLRVTTITRSMVNGAMDTESLQRGFDQEAAAVVMAKLVGYKMESEEDFSASRWLDRSLIRICSRFGTYQKDEPSSFSLTPSFSLFPQFMFNLRRSQFVQVSNNSPDETAHFVMMLNRENVTNSILMIQPSLISYSLTSPPGPVLLDVAAIAPDRILLLDAYFSVVVFHGMQVAQWRNAKFQEQPEYESFAELLKAPLDDANAILQERFPVPRLVICDQHGSQARFLLARLNPSATYNTAPPGASELIFTDDVSLQVFLEHLQRLAVHGQN